MVGIGIIALMLSILVPTIARAREQATRTKCASNLRQILLSCTNYESNWNSSLPLRSNWHGPEVAGYRPPGWLYEYPQGATATSTQEDVQNGSLYGFLGTSKVYHCPDDTETDLGGPVHRLTSYLMNGAACGYGKQLPSYKVTMFDTGAHHVLGSRPQWTIMDRRRRLPQPGPHHPPRANGGFPSPALTATSSGCPTPPTFNNEAQKAPWPSVVQSGKQGRELRRRGGHGDGETRGQGEKETRRRGSAMSP